MLWSEPIGYTSRQLPATRGVKMRSLLPAVAEQLIRDVQKTYQETSQSKTTLVKGDKCDSWSIRGFNIKAAVGDRRKWQSRL